MAKVGRLFLLGLLLAASCALRLFGFDWGSGQHFHPDEIGITSAALDRVTLPPGTSLGRIFDLATSPLNPRAGGVAYPYGALPLYVVKAAASLATAGDFQSILLTGRIVAGLFDTATVLLVFLVGIRLWSWWWGLFAASLYGLGVLPIQTAHFFISDPFMVFFMTATLLFSLLYYKAGRSSSILLAGISGGLAMACKLSAAPVLVLPFAALLLRELAVREKGEARVKPAGLAGLLALSLLGAFAGLFAGDPYGLLDAPSYVKQVADQASVQTGANDVWFTRRYVGTWPVLYPWWQLALLGAGPLTGLVGSLGVMVAAARVWLRRDWACALLLAGALAYFASIAFLEAKWVRYLLPLVPYLCLLATLCVMWLFSRGKASTEEAPAEASRNWAWVLLGTLVVVAALGALAYMPVYAHDQTRVQASKWLYANVPPGGKIGVEINDGVLPVTLKGYPPPQQYDIMQIRMLADFPSQQAFTYLRDSLRGVDYLVVGSIRAVRTVPRMPWRYPVQGRYYDLLFGGKLGFVPAYTAASYPSLFGIQFPDDDGWVDPSFIEYDHPTVRIFKKERDLTDHEWDALFADAVKQPSIATRSAP